MLDLACCLWIHLLWVHRLCVSTLCCSGSRSEDLVLADPGCVFPIWPGLWSAWAVPEWLVWAMFLSRMIWQVAFAFLGGLHGVLLEQLEVVGVPYRHPRQCAVVVAVAAATVVGLCHHLLLLAEQSLEAVRHSLSQLRVVLSTCLHLCQLSILALSAGNLLCVVVWSWNG